MKKLMVAVKLSEGIRGITLIPCIFYYRNLKKFIKDNPTITNGLSIKVMCGAGSKSFIQSLFHNIEFTLLTLKFNGEYHLTNSPDIEFYELDNLIYYNSLTDKIEIFDMK